MSNGGFHVGFEGLDGSGKTDLIESLAAYMESKGRSVHKTKEPGNNPLGKAHRELSKIEEVNSYTLILTTTAERSLKTKDISEKLEAGDVVLSDRYYVSGLAYHHAVDGVSFSEYAKLNEDIIKPDVYVYLDIEVNAAKTRIKESRKSKPDRWENRLEAVKKSYEDAITYVEENEEARVIRIDASQDREKVLSDVIAGLEEYMGYV